MATIQESVEQLLSTVSVMNDRITADVAHLQDLLQQALATETANQAEIDRLKAEATAVVESINQATAIVASIDPLPDFPEPVPAPVEPPVEPVEDPDA